MRNYLKQNGVIMFDAMNKLRNLGLGRWYKMIAMCAGELCLACIIHVKASVHACILNTREEETVKFLGSTGQSALHKC